MNYFKNLSLLSLLLFCLLPSKASSQNWKLVWSEEFNGTSLNTNTWSYETGNGQGGWGTGQMDYATDRKENVDVKNGKLIITLREEEYYGADYTSGRILSKNKYSVKYGKIEARIKVAAGRGIGCAFWMLPQSEAYGWWPASGEIDIVETNGHEPYRNFGTLHFKQWEGHQFKGHDVISEKSLASEMHTYTLIWDENVMKWYLDNKLFNEFYIKEPIDGRRPFNEEFFFIISGGVGSDFSGKKIDNKLLPQTFEVDYIRVYKPAEEPFITHAMTSNNGKEIEIRFSEHLKNPDKYFKSFEVVDHEKAVEIVSAEMKSRDNQTLLLQLKNPVSKNSLITLNYTGDSIATYSAIPLNKFNNKFIVNSLPGSSPTPIEASTKYDFTIDFVFNKNIKGILKTEDFNLKVNGKDAPIQKISFNTAGPNKVIIQTENPLFYKDTILVSYKGNTIMAADSGLLQPFLEFQVINSLKEKFSIPGKIEAENYTLQSGMMSETCNDEGGGRNMAYIEDNDWLEFNVYVKKAGNYRIEYRTASEKTEGVVALKSGENTLTKTSLKSTGSWQTWETTKSEVFALKPGIQTIRIVAGQGGFNLNWINVVQEGM